MPKLFRLVYCSRSRIPNDREVQKAELENILASARRNNARDDITGALLFTEGSFAQVLEGALLDVEATLANIELDPRHDNVRIMELGPVAKREFANWSMAFAGKHVSNNPLLGHVLTEAFADIRPGAGELLSFLRQAI